LDLGFQSDDFTIDSLGKYPWMVSNPFPVFIKSNLVSGEQQVIFNVNRISDPMIADASAVAFGKTKFDTQVLYIVTNGGQANPGALGLRGGQILALDKLRQSCDTYLNVNPRAVLTRKKFKAKAIHNL
jgi:hypothetical protein